MLNALSTPVVAAAPPQAAKSSAAPAREEPAGEEFAQALDEAAAKQPKAPGRERLRGAARFASGTEPAKAAPPPMPALVEGKDHQTMPPQNEADESGADGAPPQQGLAALLAELRAAAPPAPAGGPAQGPTETSAKTSPAPVASSDNSKRGAAGHAANIDSVGAESGQFVAVTLAAPSDKGNGSHEGNRDGSREGFAQMLGAAAASDSAAARIETMPAPQAAAASALTSASPIAAPAQAEAQLLATPGSAEFGSQLGTQISTFVRDGIQHARLHLNPADMGPVSVQIQLEGQTAVVHLSAENALTRQALEQAMPQLAGSLREAGLTLTGGGVFEQPRQGDAAQPQADGGGQRGRSDARPGSGPDEALRADAGALTARRRGIVDLVA